MPVMDDDVAAALQAELYALLPQSLEKVTEGIFRTLFDVIQNGTDKYEVAPMHSPGQFGAAGDGEDLPIENSWQGKKVTITPSMLGQAREFNFRTVEQVKAAGHDLLQATENWGKASETTKDQECANIFSQNPTIYDTKALFATDHPQRSRQGDGSSLSNTSTASGGAVSFDTLKTMLTAMMDTNAIGENGEKIDVNPTHMVSCRLKDHLEMVTTLQSLQKAGTANNDINPLSDLRLTPTLWRRAAATTAYIYGVEAKTGLKLIEQIPFTMEAARDFKSKKLMATAHQAEKAGVQSWQGIYRQQVDA